MSYNPAPQYYRPSERYYTPAEQPVQAPNSSVAQGLQAGMMAAKGAGIASSTYAAPVAAAAIAAAGTARGFGRAADDWKAGNKEQAINRGVASTIAPFSGFSNSDTLQKVIAFNPLTAPITVPLAFSQQLWGSNKDKRQVGRDSWREQAINEGVLNEDYSGFYGTNLGNDGGFRFEDGRKIYEVTPDMEKGKGRDFSQEEGRAVASFAPLADIIAGGNKEIGSYGTAMLVNDLKETGNLTDERIKNVYDKYGGFQKAFDNVTTLYQSGLISEEDARIHQNSLNQLYGKEGKASSESFPNYSSGYTPRYPIGSIAQSFYK